MKNLNYIADELFNKIRGRFPSVTIGDGEGKVTNKPEEARFFDFDYKEGENKLGKVSVSLSEESIEVMYSNDFVANEDSITRDNWYSFLKQLREFSKKRLLKFDTRNINKSNLDQRDYKFLATNRNGDDNMNEAKMYGTSTTSYQKIGEARIAIKHSKPVNTESSTGRIQSIKSIYIESPEGERFKYPFKHVNGARAMARHVAEGGNPYDDFGKHITGLSEELSSLKKFKSYVNRSSVMAEGLADYITPVSERMQTIKKTISSLQKESTYKATFEGFESVVMEEVPEDVAENWIDQLTIKQFNEELKDVFPFVYRLVSEASKAKELNFEDIMEEEEIHIVQKGDTVYSLSQQSGTPVEDIIEINGLDDNATIKVGQKLIIPGINQIGASPTTPGATRGIPPKDNYSPEDLERLLNQGKYEDALDNEFESIMGQFAEGRHDGNWTKDGVEMCSKDCCGQPVTECTCGPDCKHCDCYEKNKAMKENNKGSNWILGKLGYNVVKPQDLIDKATEISNRYQSLVTKGTSSSAEQSSKMLHELYMELINLSREIQKMGGGNKTMINAQQQLKMIKAAARGDGAAANRLAKAAQYEPKLIIDFVKQDVQSMQSEGNEFAQKVQQMKAAGAKKGDKFKTSDGKEHTLEDVTEYVLSMYDRETGQFPKGETAVLTAVEKDYGEQYINPAKQFIEMINAKFEELHGYKDPELMDDYTDESALMGHIGKKKYGKDGMAALSKAGRDGASEEELGAIKDKYKKESADILKLAGL